MTQFLSPPVPGKVDGADDAKSGRVTVIATATDTVTGTSVAASARRHRLPGGGRRARARSRPGADFTFPTGAYPNQLNNVAIKGPFAYVPNTGASPNGPFRFDVNMQSLLQRASTAAGGGAGAHQPAARGREPDEPGEALPDACPGRSPSSTARDAGFVVSAASNVVVKMAVDPATGAPTVQIDPDRPDAACSRSRRGKNPRGIVVDRAGHARLRDELRVARRDRDRPRGVSPSRGSTRLESANLPTPGTLDDTDPRRQGALQHVDRRVRSARARRAADRRAHVEGGWGACSACHPFGLSDNVVWIFPDGPRRTIPQHTDFDPSDPLRARSSAC